MGPHIYINSDRAPAIVGLKVSMINALPFLVRTDSLRLELSLESHGLTILDRSFKENIAANTVLQIGVGDIQLTDGQARIVQQHSNDRPILRISGHVSCLSVAGDFSKSLQSETRAFIFRGTRK